MLVFFTNIHTTPVSLPIYFQSVFHFTNLSVPMLSSFILFVGQEDTTKAARVRTPATARDFGRCGKFFLKRPF